MYSGPNHGAPIVERSCQTSPQRGGGRGELDPVPLRPTTQLSVKTQGGGGPLGGGGGWGAMELSPIRM